MGRGARGYLGGKKHLRECDEVVDFDRIWVGRLLWGSTLHAICGGMAEMSKIEIERRCVTSGKC